MPDRFKPSFVIFDIWALLMLKAECQSARMSKIANDGLTRSGTGCFIAVPILQHSKASKSQLDSTATNSKNSVTWNRCWLL